MQWTEGEVKFLMARAASVPAVKLAEALGKSEVTVRMMALKMGIKLLPEPPARVEMHSKVGLSEVGNLAYSYNQQ